MDQQDLYAIEARCTQEAPPRCRTACPFGLDVRTFLEKLEAGKTADARKILERHVPLPELVARICDHPCESVCLRRDLGGGLAVHALERFCVENSRAGTVLARSLKPGTVAVLGNGLAGLIVAAEMVRKSIAVTVYHAGSAESGIRRRFPEVPEGLLARVLPEGPGVAFVRTTPDAALLERLQEQARTAEGEALGIFVDADACPELVPPRGQVDPDTLLCGDLCCGGWLETSPTGHTYASASRQGADGRRAATTLQRRLEGVSLTAVREEADKPGESRLHVRLEGIAPEPRRIPAGGVCSEEDARAEAGRCLRCSCLACVKECVFLQKYRSFPRAYARQIYNNMSIVKGQHLANRVVNGCTLCGQCTELCPERFSMAELCLSARKDMVDRAYMPPSAHHFALEDMADATGPAAFVLPGDVSGEGTNGQGVTARFALFPGCQLPASRPEQTAALYALLQPLWRARGGLALFQDCCGVPAHWAGRETAFQEHTGRLQAIWDSMGRPRLLMACASCLKTFREALPHIPVRSLWEACNELDPAVFPQYSTSTDAPPLVMHDPCAARHDDGWKQAVRALAVKRGVTVVEPRLTGTETACCGYGGLVWNADPELGRAMVQHRAAELTAAGHTALTSCVMCRDRLGKSMPALHVLDLLVPRAATGPEAGIPGISARRANRVAFKARLTGGQVATGSGLHIPDSVLLAMEERFILREDVETAVAGVEAAGRYFVETESGHRVGSWRPGAVTFWVRYARTAEGLVLHEAWCHRMRVPGASHPRAFCF